MHVFGQILGHALGQRGDQGAIALCRRLAHLVDDVVDLARAVLGHRADLDRRVDEAGRADHLFDENAAGLVEFPRARRGRDFHRLRPHRLPFLEFERAIVEAGGQAEAVIGEGFLAVIVAAIHRPELRDGDMALIGEDEGVFRDVFEQGGRRLARLAAGEIARIILDAGAGAGRLEHFNVELGALLQALGLQELALLLHPGEAFLELGLDLDDGLIEGRARGDIVGIGVEADRFQLVMGLAGERVELGNGLDLVAEEIDAPGAVVIVGRENLEIIAAQAEGAADEGLVVSCVLQVDELAHDGARIDQVAGLHIEGHRRIGLDRADAVNARDRGDDNHIIALENGARRSMAHPVDGLVDGAFLLDIGIRPRHIGLGHVVIVI